MTRRRSRAGSAWPKARAARWRDDFNGFYDQPPPTDTEATNSLIQAAKRRTRGYRSKTTMITIIYLTAGKLPLPQIHTIERGAFVCGRLRSPTKRKPVPEPLEAMRLWVPACPLRVTMGCRRLDVGAG